jgi:hypothetical protein
MGNRWFKGNGQITMAIELVIVGNRFSQRESKLDTKLVKLPLGDTATHDCLKNWVELSQEDLYKELKKDEWITKITF